MAGAYCRFCDRRCFVYRDVVVAGVRVWGGHMATCYDGKAHDRKAVGMDSDTAHNPAWEGCACAGVCKPTQATSAAALHVGVCDGCGHQAGAHGDEGCNDQLEMSHSSRPCPCQLAPWQVSGNTGSKATPGGEPR